MSTATANGAHVNGTGYPKVGDAARQLVSRGFAVCKPDPGEKKPTYKGWTTRSLTPEEFSPGDMIGVIGGPLSDGNRPGHATVIVDLDSTAAVEKADEYLPETGMEDGRPGKLRTHRFYLVPLATVPEWAESQAKQAAPAAKKKAGHTGPFKKAFKDAQRKTAIDFIGTGGQVVAPPSVWTNKDGTRQEVRAWVGGEPGEPAVVPFPELWEAVCRLAEACDCKAPDVGEAGSAEESEPEWEPTPDPNPDSAPEQNGHSSSGTFVLVARSEAMVRASAYLAKMDPAVSGHDGHGSLFKAARAMERGFDLGVDDAFDILKREYNPRCQPLWSDAELRHKCQQSKSTPYRKPRGWLLRDGFANFRVVMKKVKDKAGNVVKDESGKDVEQEVREPLSVNAIREKLLTLTDGWPRRCGGMLFVEGEDHTPLWLTKPDELFAWVNGWFDGDLNRVL